MVSLTEISMLQTRTFKEVATTAPRKYTKLKMANRQSWQNIIYNKVSKQYPQMFKTSITDVWGIR